MTVLTEARPLAFSLSSPAGAVSIGTAPDDPVVLLPGHSGLDDLPVEVQATTAATLDGETVTGRRVPAAEVFLPLRLKAPSLTALRELRARVRAAANTALGVCTFTVTAADGSRSVTGTASVRDEAADGTSWGPRAGGWGQRLGLVIRTHEPAWVGPTTSVAFPAPTQVSFFPLLPPRLSSSSALNRRTVLDVGGDLPTPARWRIAGPWSVATLTNHTLGRVTQLVPPVPLTADEAATVDTDPRALVRVAAPDGTSAWTWLRPPYDLWPVAPGHSVSVVLDGAAGTSVTTLTVRPRWRSAL